MLVRLAAARRGTVRPDTPRDDDLDDPYQAPQVVFAACGTLVADSLLGPLDLLAGG